ncbi:sulfonate transport system permease protein [Arthrobacter sp. cf158]|uniref:ABC transporter permease n=1 Tax=Arthrobacter sp. cf158 TaxID=1761744 RepID=UPI000897B5B9|nr:ABC transporter permease [Arthrobacter sp. cf158]SDW12742.1 sulfonate transport system permease protein [Arthrobacter sp. cf158]
MTTTAARRATTVTAPPYQGDSTNGDSTKGDAGTHPGAAVEPHLDPALTGRPDVRPTSRRLGPGQRRRFAGLVGPAALILLWVVASATGLLDPRILSEPWTVVATAGELIADGRLQENLAISAQRAGLGLFFGIVVGAVLAVLSGLSRVGESLIDGPVQIKRAIPGLALIPLLILWFGIDETMKVLTITLGVFVPIYLQTHAGLRGIDLRYVELAQTVGLSRAGFIRRVVLPGALPGFFLGLRFAVTGAWVSLVVVEQINSTSGIGYMMELARTYGQTNIIVLGLAVYGVLGLLSDAAVRLLERKALSWQRTLAG